MKTARKIFDWLIFAPALIPLIWYSGLFYPYIAPKTFLFRFLILSTLALFCFLVFSRGQFYWSRLRQKVAWIPAALLFVAFITSLLGVDFYRSFWSTFERGDGLLTLSLAVVSFYLILLSSDSRTLAKLYRLIAWVASFVALYAVLQWIQRIAGIDIPLITDPIGRIGSSLGNAAYLSSYLCFSLFATYHTLRGEFPGFKKTLWQVSIALQAIALLAAATRGAFVALLVVFGMVIVYLAFRSKTTHRKSARIVLGASLALLALFFVFKEPLKNSSFTPIQRLASISLSENTVSSRFFLWKEIGAEALRNPVSGYGAEHISELFDLAYDPGRIGEQWFDRSHNSYLDYFVQFGIFGLILYICLIGSGIFIGKKLLGRGDESGAILMLMFAVYAIQTFFVFDTISVFWMLLAILAAGVAAYTKDEKSSTLSSAIPSGVGVALGGLVFVLIFPVVVQPARANRYLGEAYVYHLAEPVKSISILQKGLSLETYADLEYGYQVYQMYTDRQAVRLSGENLVSAYKSAESILGGNYERFPYDVRTATYYAHVLDLAPAGLRDEKKLEQVLLEAAKLSPKRSQLWYIRANIFINKGDKAQSQSEKIEAYQAAVSILEEYVKEIPSQSEPHFILATIFLLMKDNAKAQMWVESGAKLYKGEYEAARRAQRYYFALEDWKSSARYMEDIIKATPDDYDTTYDLAKISYLAGDIQRALELVAFLRKAKPGLVETDQPFLQALGV